jgi:hypothetical protein
MYLSMWKAALLVIGFVLLLGSGCSGDEDSKGDSAAAPKPKKVANKRPRPIWTRR